MKALVAGSAQLDVVAISNEDIGGTARSGRISMEVGGAACNVAFGLRRTGADVNLLTAWNDSPMSKLVEGYILASGVHVFADVLPDMPMPAQVQQLCPSGRTQSIISSSPLDAHVFSAAHVVAAIRNVDCVVFDANLSQDAVLGLCRAAAELEKPIFGLAVSEQKAARLLAGSGMLTAAFMNHLECEEIMVKIGAGDATEVADVMRAPIFVTRGERGVMIYAPEEKPVRVPAHKVYADQNHRGASEAFAVGVIDAMVRFGMPAAPAAAYAHNFVADIGRSLGSEQSLNTFSNLVATLYRTARHDTLTGLLARGAFEEDYPRMAKSRNTLMMIDCDRFKSVNDRLGHDKGDEVLRAVADIIQNSVRVVDVACRWGGDEFVVLLPRTSLEDAWTVAERVRAAAESAELYGVTLSIGLTATHLDESLCSIVQRSDQAMYSSKTAGKNTVTLG